MGPLYGVQWRSWRTSDGGRAELVQGLKDNSDSCRNIVSAWNVSELQGMALPPEAKRQLSEPRLPQCPVKDPLLHLPIQCPVPSSARQRPIQRCLHRVLL